MMFVDNLGGGFKYFQFSPRKIGEMIQFEEHIFQLGWFNHQLDNPLKKGLIYFFGWEGMAVEGVGCHRGSDACGRPMAFVCKSINGGPCYNLVALMMRN